MADSSGTVTNLPPARDLNKGFMHFEHIVEGELMPALSNSSLSRCARKDSGGVSFRGTPSDRRGVLSRRGVEGDDKVVFESELSVRSGIEVAKLMESFEVDETGEVDRLLGEPPRESRKTLLLSKST